MEVIEVMSRFAVIERASIDEAYMDLTAAVQQRLKNMSESQIDSMMLSTTYVQGFPQKSPEDQETTENGAPSKGNPVAKVTNQLLLLGLGFRIGLEGSSALSLNMMFCCRGSEVRWSPPVVRNVACAATRGAELCRAAAHCGSSYCGGNESCRGEAHGFPLFGGDITQ